MGDITKMVAVARRSLAALALFSLVAALVAAANAGAQTNAPPPKITTGDLELDKACLEIFAAPDADALSRVYQFQYPRLAGTASRAEQAVRELHAAPELGRAEAALKAGERAAAEAKAKLSNILTSVPSADQHARNRDDAQRELNDLADIERRHTQAESDLKSPSVNTAERKLKEQERDALKQRIERTDKRGILQRLRAAERGYEEKTQGVEALRKQIAALEKLEAAARVPVATLKRRIAEAEAEATLASARQAGFEKCALQRRYQIDPDLIAKLKRLDELLESLGRGIAGVEARAAPLKQPCAGFDAEIAALRTMALEIGRSADALTVKARTQPGSAADAQRQAATAIADARIAAAAVTTARAHAAQVAQVACQASKAVVDKPTDPKASALLDAARDNRTAAEADVAKASAALNQIRALHAGLQAGPTRAALGGELAGLKGRLAALRGQHATLAKTASDAAAVFRDSSQIADRLYSLAQSAKNEDSLERERKPQIDALVVRVLAAVKLACPSNSSDAVKALAVLVAAAAAKVGAAETAVSSAGAPPAASNAGTQIEAIFTAARTDADGVAAEATKAVGCDVAARQAHAAAASTGTSSTSTSTSKPKLPAGAVDKPIPGKPNGLSCRYVKGTSYVEFILYDVKTCPPTIEDYPLASAKPVEVASTTEKDFGDKAADFTGRWLDTREQSWAITITNGKASRFPISAETVYSGGDNAKTKWTGTCQRLEINKVECGGSGTFENNLRVAEFKVKAVLYVFEGKTMTHDFEYTEGRTVRMKFEGHKPQPFNVGKFKGNQLTKQ
jgi:hypothetical protein